MPLDPMPGEGPESGSVDPEGLPCLLSPQLQTHCSGMLQVLLQAVHCLCRLCFLLSVPWVLSLTESWCNSEACDLFIVCLSLFPCGRPSHTPNSSPCCECLGSWLLEMT